ncbi:hypothetical protein J6590_020823 [Homalodisca vitripennis]|nr:hypothetical protein J6590_020823 [Homalodisca vitripennis]
MNRILALTSPVKRCFESSATVLNLIIAAVVLPPCMATLTLLTVMDVSFVLRKNRLREPKIVGAAVTVECHEFDANNTPPPPHHYNPGHCYALFRRPRWSRRRGTLNAAVNPVEDSRTMFLKEERSNRHRRMAEWDKFFFVELLFVNCQPAYGNATTL